jgi:hypothetical protein
MAQRLEASSASEAEVSVFVEKLRQFHSTLPVHEQQLLDAVLLTAAGEERAVEAYGLDGAAAKRATLVALVALSIGVGGLSAPLAGTAQASGLAQPTGPVITNPIHTPAGGILNTPGGQPATNTGSIPAGTTVTHLPSGSTPAGAIFNTPGGQPVTDPAGTPAGGGTPTGGGTPPSNSTMPSTSQTMPSTSQTAPASTPTHWVNVQPSYQYYYGPTYTYDYDWYFSRHISFPWLYQISNEEPAEGLFAEYYFYEGVYYCFVG